MQDKNESRSDFFPEGLKKVRKLLNLKQNELASIAGHTGYQTISRYERGERFPDKSILVVLCSVLNVSTDWILTGTINRNYSYGLQSALKMLKKQPSDIAGKLNIPLPFIEAVVAGEIGVSDEFYDRMCEEGLGIKSERFQYDKVSAELEKQKTDSSRISTISGPPPDGYVVEPQSEKVEELRTKLDTCYERYFELQEENKKLRLENGRLKESGKK